MIMDHQTIEPGKSFRIGMIFDISPGWHIYWTNPGDAGLATSVKLHVPPGFKVGKVVFPVPTQFPMPGGIICYGYNTQLMLIAQVTPPDDLKARQQIPITAETDFLVCERICIGGKQSTSEIYTAAKGSGPRNVELFDHWQSLIPTPADQSPFVQSVSNDDNSVMIIWQNPVTDVTFFPGTSDAMSIGNITVLNRESHTQILFVPKYYDKTKLALVSCVAGFIDPQGVHRAVEFPVSFKGNN